MDISGNGDAIPGIHAQIAAAFDWWRDAGVDCDFQDLPHSWLAEPEPIADQAAAPPPIERQAAQALLSPAIPASLIALGALPQELDAFPAWWLAEPSLDGGRVTNRVPPRGPANPEIMVLVDHPEREDSETLLSGPQGRLLDAMLAAMGVTLGGIPPGGIYVASALPRHTPHADWAAIRAQGMGEVLARHIALAAPRRLLVFGGNVLPLLGNDLPNTSDNLPSFNHDGVSIPLLADRDLGTMLERPRWKSVFWQRWLDWVG